MACTQPVDLDRLAKLIKTLIDFARSENLISDLTRDDIEYILHVGMDALARDASLISLPGPVIVAGGLFGDIRNLLDLLDTTGMPPKVTYLILGDIVSKGKNSIEVVCLLYSLKATHPSKLYLLRGQQETPEFLRKGGFKTEVKYRFDAALYKRFATSFTYMPVAAVIAEKVYACHGGINTEIATLDSIRALERPLKTLTGVAAGAVLAVPINRLGSSYVSNDILEYDSGAVFKFLELNHLDLILRTGEWTPQGFKYASNRTVLTIFSTRNYCDRRNPAAMVKVDRRGKVDIILCTEEVEFNNQHVTPGEQRGRGLKVSHVRRRPQNNAVA